VLLRQVEDHGDGRARDQVAALAPPPRRRRLIRQDGPPVGLARPPL